MCAIVVIPVILIILTFFLTLPSLLAPELVYQVVQYSRPTLLKIIPPYHRQRHRLMVPYEYVKDCAQEQSLFFGLRY